MALVVDHEALKGYFLTGSIPTEAQFSALIDMLALVDPDTMELVVKSGVTYAALAGQTLTAKKTLTAAQVLAFYATPVAFGLTVPSGYYVNLVSAQLGVDFNTTAFDTNTGVAIGAVGADSYIARHAAALDTNVSRVVEMAKASDLTANYTQFMDGADLEIYGLVGAALNGDSPVDIYITYNLIEL